MFSQYQHLCSMNIVFESWTHTCRPGDGNNDGSKTSVSRCTTVEVFLVVAPVGLPSASGTRKPDDSPLSHSQIILLGRFRNGVPIKVAISS